MLWGSSVDLDHQRGLRGVSMIEILLSVAIVILLTIPAVSTFRGVQARKVLESDVALVVSVLAQARSLTLASKDEKPYGVHITNTDVTLFESAVFVNGSSTNRISSLNSSVTLSQALVGGGSDVVFQRLTGETSDTGTITLTHQTAGSKTITLYGTGIAEID